MQLRRWSPERSQARENAEWETRRINMANLTVADVRDRVLKLKERAQADVELYTKRLDVSNQSSVNCLTTAQAQLDAVEAFLKLDGTYEIDDGIILADLLRGPSWLKITSSPYEIAYSTTEAGIACIICDALRVAARRAESKAEA